MIKIQSDFYGSKNSLLKLSQVFYKNFSRFLYSLNQYKNLYWNLKV